MASVASHLIEEVTAHTQSDSLEDAREICGTYFQNNLRIKAQHICPHSVFICFILFPKKMTFVSLQKTNWKLNNFSLKWRWFVRCEERNWFLHMIFRDFNLQIFNLLKPPHMEKSRKTKKNDYASKPYRQKVLVARHRFQHFVRSLS